MIKMRLILEKLRTEKNCIKIILVALSIIFICAFCNGCGKHNNDNADDSANITNDKNVTVDFINVGKGDCMVIQWKSHTFIIDTGYEETSNEVMNFLNKNSITTIDGMIITHYDKDHVGGASDIVKNYNVKKIYMPDYVGEGNKYQKFMGKLEKWNKMDIVNYVTEDMSINIDEITLDLYPAKKSFYDKENNYSIITKLTFGEDTFLFAADAEAERIEELLGTPMLDSDVLKLPYHGNLEKYYIKFIDEVSPEYGVITSDTEGDVATSIIYELEALKTKYYYNCNGDIHCISDGKGNIKFEQ